MGSLGEKREDLDAYRVTAPPATSFLLRGTLSRGAFVVEERVAFQLIGNTTTGGSGSGNGNTMNAQQKRNMFKQFLCDVLQWKEEGDLRMELLLKLYEERKDAPDPALQIFHGSLPFAGAVVDRWLEYARAYEAGYRAAPPLRFAADVRAGEDIAQTPEEVLKEIQGVPPDVQWQPVDVPTPGPRAAISGEEGGALLQEHLICPVCKGANIVPVEARGEWQCNVCLQVNVPLCRSTFLFDQQPADPELGEAERETLAFRLTDAGGQKRDLVLGVPKGSGVHRAHLAQILSWFGCSMESEGEPDGE